MGFFEWVLLIVIVAQGYRTYRKQHYWLDKQLARLLRYLRSWWR